jgi:hypothetical protein
MDALNKNRRKSRDEEKLRYITRYSVYLDGRTVCPLAVDSDNRMSEVDSDDMDYDSPSSSYTTQSRYKFYACNIMMFCFSIKAHLCYCEIIHELNR